MSPKNNTQDHMGVLLLGNFHIPEEGNYFILNYVKATAGRATLSLSLCLSLSLLLQGPVSTSTGQLWNMQVSRNARRRTSDICICFVLVACYSLCGPGKRWRLSKVSPRGQERDQKLSSLHSTDRVWFSM